MSRVFSSSVTSKVTEEGFFLFRDVEGLAERLVALGDDLDEYLPLRNRRDAGLTLLVAAQFEGGPDGLAELDNGVPLHEAHHYASVVYRLAGLVLEDDIDLRHGCLGHGAGGESGQQNGRHHQAANKAIPIAHTPIINAPRRRSGRMRE